MEWILWLIVTVPVVICTVIAICALVTVFVDWLFHH
jgi:hypothetical protein